MPEHAAGTREEWLAARKRLLERGSIREFTPHEIEIRF
jgi:hypothetical protein